MAQNTHNNTGIYKTKGYTNQVLYSGYHESNV